MPLYLCKAGLSKDEPWKHGVQVYSHPFFIEEATSGAVTIDASSWGGLAVGANTSVTALVPLPASPRLNDSQGIILSMQNQHLYCFPGRDTNRDLTNIDCMRTSNLHRSGMAIRRVRHLEVVLVDEVAMCYGRYWLRVRWPGGRGGVAGYIDLGSMSHYGSSDSVASPNVDSVHPEAGFSQKIETGGDMTNIDLDNNNLHAEKEADDNDGFICVDSPSTICRQSQHLSPRCKSTGLLFPSSSVMELLALYDDGLNFDNLSSLLINNNESDVTNEHGGESVFCRICREGLHDVKYDTHDIGNDLDGTPCVKEEATNTSAVNHAFLEARPGCLIVDAFNSTRYYQLPQQYSIGGNSFTSQEVEYDKRNSEVLNDKQNEPVGDLQIDTDKRILSPNLYGSYLHENISVITHHPYMENPLLVPCECSGSMAFVHYLCLEQWRCRSHHPDARNGLNCETCGGSYTLPPPPSRPLAPDGDEGVVGAGEEDWLEAMPPHVLAALRHPHPWWKMGAAIVRRKWLRPIAPVFMSPIVALYCRARRTLKKRGVSRRRWACSLCRRRARWKCVRCLRSYYCSRQCQNVSWHIVHKHVCYKPVRLWWSVLVYGIGIVLLFPGILEYPTIYDIGLSLLLASFLVMGAIGGGMATLLKRVSGVDIRGRSLELFVVVMTIWLASVNWGLVWGFFGDSSKCLGVMTSMPQWRSVPDHFTVSDENNDLSTISPFLKLAHSYVFRPGKMGIHLIDRIVQRAGPNVTQWICVRNEDRDTVIESTGFNTTICLRMARDANPEFFLTKNGGEKCASDVSTVAWIWLFSRAIKFAGFFCVILKRRERNRRAGDRPRLHQE